MHTLELAENAARMNVASHMVDILLRRQLSQNDLVLNLAVMKRKGFNMENTLLQKIKGYNYINVNLAKINVIDPTKVNFTQLLIVQEISDESEISKNDY